MLESFFFFFSWEGKVWGGWVVGRKDKLDSEERVFGRDGKAADRWGSGREVAGRKKYWVGKELERGAEKW